MKKDIHPKVNTECVVKCACGNTFTTISTLDEITVEICNLCHPYFTGTQKFVDTEGRIDKFEKKRQKAETMKKAVKEVTDKKKSANTAPSQETPKSVKELLNQLKKEDTEKDNNPDNQ